MVVLGIFQYSYDPYPPDRLVRRSCETDVRPNLRPEFLCAPREVHRRLANDLACFLVQLAANYTRELRCVCVLLEPGHFAIPQPPYVNKLSIHVLAAFLESAGVPSQCYYAVSSIKYFVR